MSPTLVNLTPHELVIKAHMDSPIRVPVGGAAARVRESRGGTEELPTSSGVVPVTEISYANELINLPAAEPGVFVVVSRIAAAAASSRTDLLFPLDEIRDSDGRIVGCAGLGRFTEPPLQDGRD